MMTMRCVLLVCALCAWCACGCAAVELKSRGEESKFGGYALVADVGGALEQGKKSCASDAAASEEDCKDANKNGPLGVSVTCTGENPPESCTTLSDPEDCKERPTPDCNDAAGSGTGSSCAGGKKKLCPTVKEVKANNESESHDVNTSPTYHLITKPPPCPSGQAEVDGSCVSSGTQLKEDRGKANGEKDGHTDTAEHAEQHLSRSENVDGEGNRVAEQCDSSKTGPCPSQPGKPPGKIPVPRPQPQPQPHRPNVERNQENIIKGGTNKDESGEETQLENTGDVTGGVNHNPQSQVQNGKTKEANGKTDDKSGPATPGSEINGDSTSTNREELSSDPLPPAERTPAADNTAED
ncbi:hypothetical protein DQ04_10791000, partial [Trypanosoma grayi]|uniref:hypothetical protein n=1 Tax=Trypanosoma grayi TaxID=71804 RepID=UPI0004F40DF7